MIKLYNCRLLALICFMSVAVFAACKKDDNRNSGRVELLSFGPTGAKHGDTVRFFGMNLNRVNSIEFTGTNASVDKSEFKRHTSDEILLIVPASAERGYVTLKTSDGDIVTKTQLNLSVSTAVTSFTPEARPGENITITGNFLNWVNKITFADDKEVTTFVSKTLNQIVVRVPDDAQTGPLLISYQGTDSSFVQTSDTLKVKLPVATALSPNPVKHAENLTITGTDLDLTKQVLFTGVTAPVTAFESQSASQLVVKVPGGTQTGEITLVAASGVHSVASMDLNILLPVITNMTPNPVDPESNITITGTNLDLVTSVTFQNAPAVTTFVSQSATQIVVKVPAGVLRGRVTLGVLNSTRTVQSPDILDITGDIPPPTLAFPLYTDAVTSNWNGWIGGGWGGTSNRDNAAPVREGTKSIKIDYTGGYGSPFQIGGANINLATYTTFNLSVYGAPGSGGKTVTIGINGVNGKYNFNVVEGKWTDYAIPLSTLTSDTELKEIWIQEYSGTGGFTIFVDAIGLN
jgi:hypothetical protein